MLSSELYVKPLATEVPDLVQSSGVLLQLWFVSGKGTHPGCEDAGMPWKVLP